MEYLEFRGVTLPLVGIGTWGMGGGSYADRSDDAKEIDAIRYAVSLGMSHIDTAEYYGSGHAEEIVRDAVEGMDRKSLFITSKVWSDDLSYSGIINAAKRSLHRLSMDYMDLYLIHWPNPSFPLDESMEAMDELVKRGQVRHIGVSNFSLDLLKRAQSLSRNPIFTNQVHYSLLTRDPEEDILPFCQKEGILLTAYTPVERGLLTRPGLKELDTVAKKHGKTRAQVAINWLVSQRNVITIPKASSRKHLEENAGAVGWMIDEEDRILLDRLADR